MMAPRFYSVPWLPFDVHAVTLPPFGIFILKRKRNNFELRMHEIGHWKQYQEWGLLDFYWAVFTQYIKYGRFHAPIEKDATRRGRK